MPLWHESIRMPGFSGSSFDVAGLPSDGILKAEHFASLKRAEGVEFAARRKAAAYLRRARDRGRQARKSAREAGYAEGFLHFSAAVQRLEESRSQLQVHLEALLRRSLQQVLGRMPKEEWLPNVLGEVVGEIRGCPEIVIMVHPANLPAVTAAISAARRGNKYVAPMRSEPNPQMSEHDCLVYAGMDVIDLSLTVVVEEMIAALRLMTGTESDVEAPETRSSE